jgi:hypothetical protein
MYFVPHALQAAAYIERQFEEHGYAVERLAYDVSGLRCLNLEITHGGGAREREILLIGAHYDTVVGSPGANDNASGVSALLELSRLFANAEPALTVRFVAFVNKEAPFFTSRQQGSMVYAESARRRGDDIRLMASLETIGWHSDEPGSQSYPPLFRLFYPDHGGIVSNFRSKAVMRRLAAAFRANSDFPLETAATFPFVPGDFLERPSVFLAARLSRRNDHRYGVLSVSALSRDDTPDKLAYLQLTRVTLGLYAAFLELARAGVD